MAYIHKDMKPIEIAEQFIDSYISRTPIEKFVPYANTATYHHGVFLSGVESIYLQNKKKEYVEYMEQFFGIVLSEDKRLNRVEGNVWRSLDSLDFRQPGILLCRPYEETKDERYLKSIGELVESLKTDYPTNSKGGFWHMRSQPNQMWLDGLYMVSPLCAKYSIYTGKNEFGDIAINQAILMYENMVDKKNGLLYHGWDEGIEAPWADKVTGLSAEKWGRAVGWFTVAAVDILETLGTTFKNADILLGYVQNIFKALTPVQKESGYWCQVIDKPDFEGNWEETSCTCLIAYSMAKAVRLGFIEEEYLASAKKAYNAVVDSLKTDDSGQLILDKICVGTCIDEGTYEHYISRDTESNDLHGSGAFLLLCGEINKCV